MQLTGIEQVAFFLKKTFKNIFTFFSLLRINSRKTFQNKIL